MYRESAAHPGNAVATLLFTKSNADAAHPSQKTSPFSISMCLGSQLVSQSIYANAGWT